MEQLICHLLGDYILQTDKQAVNKATSTKYALLHAFTYTLPFILITHSIAALAVICLTHALIDRFRMAKYVVMVKNGIDDLPGLLKGKFNTPTGFREEAPVWLATWLFIIADNTMHLAINYLSLKFLG